MDTSLLTTVVTLEGAHGGRPEAPEPGTRRARWAKLAWPLVLMTVATALWGVTNVIQKQSLEHLGPFAVAATRCALGSFVLLPLMLRERSRGLRIGQLARSGPVMWAAAAFCIGLCLQQIGSGETSATNLGFLINVSVVFVPVILWGLEGQAPAARVFVAAAMILFGAMLLSGFGSRFAAGDAFCVASALAYGIWTIAVGRAMTGGSGASTLTFLQLAFTAVVAAGLSAATEAPAFAGFQAFAPGLLFLGVGGTGVACALSAQAQRGLTICAAAITMNLESIFTAIAGHTILGESLGLIATGGCCIILLGIVLAQLQGTNSNVTAGTRVRD